MFRTIIAATLIFSTTSPALAYCLSGLDMTDYVNSLNCRINELSDHVNDMAYNANSNVDRLNEVVRIMGLIADQQEADRAKISDLEARLDSLQNE